MKKEIKVQRIASTSLLKLLIIGNSLSFTILGLIAGVMSLFGAQVVKFNDQYITGIYGLLAAPIIGLFVSVFFSGFLWVFCIIGLLIYSKFRTVTIEIIESK